MSPSELGVIDHLIPYLTGSAGAVVLAVVVIILQYKQNQAHQEANRSLQETILKILMSAMGSKEEPPHE